MLNKLLLAVIESENYYHRQKAMVFKVTIAIGAIIPAQPSGPIILRCFQDDQPSPAIIYDGCQPSVQRCDVCDASPKPIAHWTCLIAHPLAHWWSQVAFTYWGILHLTASPHTETKNDWKLGKFNKMKPMLANIAIWFICFTQWNCKEVRTFWTISSNYGGDDSIYGIRGCQQITCGDKWMAGHALVCPSKVFKLSFTLFVCSYGWYARTFVFLCKKFQKETTPWQVFCFLLQRCT